MSDEREPTITIEGDNWQGECETLREQVRDMAARLLAAKEAAARAELLALFAVGDAVAMRRERDVARAILIRVHDVAGIIGMATFAGVTENQITEAQEAEIDAVLDAVAAAIGGAS